MAREAVYRNGSTEFRIPTIEDNGRFFVELKCGLLVPLPARIGNLILVADLGCEKTIEQINDLVYRFAEADFSEFLNSNPDFRDAFRNDFAGLLPSKILFHSKQLAEAAEQLEIQRMARLCGEP
jgi:hypothetical protein